MPKIGGTETLVGGLNRLLIPHQIKDEELQVLENMEVRPTSVSDTVTYLALTARSSYKRLNASNLAYSPKNLIEFIQRITGIRSAVFTGAGLNNATSGGTFSGTTYSVYEVVIDATGTPDTFKWRLNGGSYTTGVAITGAAQTLSQGVTVTFGTTTGHTVNDLWTIIAAASGQKYLVTGGFASSALKLQHLADGETSLVQISSTSSSDTGILSFFLFNQYLFYTDGNIAWRKWDGITDSASGFTTKTKYGIKHKNRAFYFNDVTNGQPHYMWVSDVGLPETVSASNFFVVGDASDPIIAAMDQIERILIIKEKSTWAFYLAPELSNSTLLRADEYKGSVSPLGCLWNNLGTFVYTGDSGIQIVRGLRYEPVVSQLQNFFKGFQNTLAALGSWEDFLVIATKNVNADTYNKRVFLYDLFTQKVYQHNLNIGCFCSNKGITTFSKRLKAIEDDGTNRYIIEFDQIASQVESTIPCVAKTKEWFAEDMSRIKKIRTLVLEANFPDTTTVLTIKSYADDVLKETKTYTPSITGSQRFSIKFLPNVTRGYHISFQFEYAQPGTVANKFAIFGIPMIEGDLEARIE